MQTRRSVNQYYMSDQRAHMAVFNYILGMYKTNCFLITSGTDAVIVDPADRCTYLVSKLEEKGLKLRRILLTHAHFDHILATNELKAATGALVCAGAQDDEGLRDVQKSYLLQLGRRTDGIFADVLLDDGDTFEECGGEFSVLLTPGHTKGSVCYIYGRDIFCGDLVFKDGFGRCDLYGGDERSLAASIVKLREFFMQNGTDYVLHPGHGDKLSAEYFMKQTDFLRK